MAEARQLVLHPARVLGLTLAILVVAVVADLSIPGSSYSNETCSRCGTVREHSWSLLGGGETAVHDEIGEWYARRVAPTHDHEWVERCKRGGSPLGLYRWACACRPHPFAVNKTAVAFVLDRLEKLDLDRSFFRLAASEEWQSEICAAAQSFPFKGAEVEVRQWWALIESWTNTPADLRHGRPPWDR